MTRAGVTRLRVVAEAEEEVAQAAEWYEARRSGLGVELVVEVDRAFEALAAAPLSCPLWRDDHPYRRRVLSRFPFGVFYRFEGAEVVVLAVAHTRRKPGYWMDRTVR